MGGFRQGALAASWSKRSRERRACRPGRAARRDARRRPRQGGAGGAPRAPRLSCEFRLSFPHDARAADARPVGRDVRRGARNARRRRASSASSTAPASRCTGGRRRARLHPEPQRRDGPLSGDRRTSRACRSRLVLDGEVLAMRPTAPAPVSSDDEPLRKEPNGRAAAHAPLSPFFFDVLHADGADLIDPSPRAAQTLALVDAFPKTNRVPGSRTDDAAGRTLPRRTRSPSVTKA